MKKSFLLVLFLMVSVVAMAQSSVAKVSQLQSVSGIAVELMKAPAAGPKKINRYNDIDLAYVPTSSYEQVSETVANYYFVATSTESRFDSNTGDLVMNSGYALMLDFYAAPSDPIALAPGVYTPSFSNDPFTYDPSFSTFQFMNASGQVTTYDLKGNIIVDCNEQGLYTVKVEEPIYSNSYGIFSYYLNVSYTGDMGFRKTTTQDQFFPAITHNVNETFTGALGVYRGNEMQSNTGCMWLYVFTAPFDDNTGGLTAPGLEVRMFLFNRLFGDPTQAEPVPGTYKVARNFQKETFFPGMEINYMGSTLPYGSMAYETDGNDANDKVAYITDGTYTIDYDGETGNYILTLDLRTSLGYKIQGTYTGPIKVIDNHYEDTRVVLSTLEEDLEMDLSRIKTMDVYRNIFTEERYGGTSYVSASTCYVSDVANKMGLNHFTVDLGYGAEAEVIGKDDEGNTLYGKDGGDLMRLEFFAEDSNKMFPVGTYEVLPDSPSANPGAFAPYKALPGYFLPGGEMGGTRWAHNAPNPYADRYWHWDGHAPAADGKFTITRDMENNTYGVNIEVIDDGGFTITGQWTGPVRLNWDIEAEGIGTVLAPGVGEDGIYDLQGRKLNTLRNGISIQGGKKILK